ncbi:hypothetical protein CTI12_AA053720 [Artemisia annua]|uniref:DUF7356 domain-containing protein n=1 Tax=Artemisia annua TaxID=35608 RepID=A0A2U1QAM6_ARTAN|nr:hypothetical protein CTI12_AA053720 [Artemisia annua]
MMNLTLFLTALFLVSLALVHSADVDPEVKKNIDAGLVSEVKTTPDPKVSLNEKSNTLESNVETKQADSIEKPKVSNDIKNDAVAKTKSVPSKDVGSTQTGNIQKDSKEKELVDNVDTKGKTDEGLKSKDVPKEEKLPSVRKGGFRGEQCDSDFKCTIGKDENKGMVACLRVSGDDVTEVSLLIQNKGKGLLDVDISAPDFIQLDKTKVQIQGNDDQKVMVSIGDGRRENFITLKTREGSCRLDFIDFINHNPLTYPHMKIISPLFLLIPLAILIVVGLAYACVNYRQNKGAKYQKLDAELPVSGGPKIDFDQKDGWNDNWSDDWGDDVEAPHTPSMPLTPSISSAGVSSRRSTKDAWKD